VALLKRDDKIWGWWSVSYPGRLRMGNHRSISVTYTPTAEWHEFDWPQEMKVVLEAPGLTIETPPAKYSFKIIDVWNKEWDAGSAQQTHIPESHSWVVTPISESRVHTVILKFDIKPQIFRTEALSAVNTENGTVNQVSEFIPSEASFIVTTVNEH